MFIDKLQALFSPDRPSSSGNEDDLPTAIAALLVQASSADGNISPEERKVRDRLLKQKFKLDDAGIATLVAHAENAEANAVDLYRFTRTIKDAYDRDTRLQVLEMLWELVLADGVIDDQEAHMVWQVSGLLGFTTRENGDARRAVQSRLQA